MSQVARRSGASQYVPFRLNTDGERHPRENALVLTTAVLGLIALVCAPIEGLHVIGAWAGVAGLVVGSVGQMLSVTTNQRWVNVIGWIAAFAGLMLSFANGGFS